MNQPDLPIVANAMTTNSEAAWVGWYRKDPSEPWRRIAEAADRRTCWHLMAEPRGGDKVVLPAGEDPNIPKQPR